MQRWRGPWARSSGSTTTVIAALGASYERWDGRGVPDGLVGPAIPIASRIAHLSEFLEVAYRTDGVEAAVALGRRRSGTQFDPGLVEIVEADAEKVFHQLDELDSWDAVIDGEPGLARTLSAEECDEALAAIARFVDLKSPSTLGHSEAVAMLAASAAAELGLPPAEQRLVHRAGLVAGLGRLGVSNAIWDKPGPLSAAEWERARLYPQLHRADVAPVPGARTGGSARRPGRASVSTDRATRAACRAPPSAGPAGSWPRRSCSRPNARPRPHRPALSVAEITRLMRDDVRAGRLDGTVVDAVLRAAGERVHRRPARPGRPHRREVEVLQCLVRGQSNREIAKTLVISPKTVGNHVEHVYTKIGVGNRAAASLFAMRHGLVPES